MGRLSAAIAVLAFSLSASPAAQPAAAFPTAAVDAWLEALHATHGFSGAVVIERDGVVVYAQGIGLANTRRKLPFTPDTRTDGASLAKPFTATALLMLAEAGAVDLDAPVRRYIAEYPIETTKVFDLLSHSAPLPDYGAFGALLEARRPVTTSAMLREAAKMPLAPPPADRPRFVYCNLCLDAAALLVERVAGQPFERVLRDLVLRPIGAERAFIRPARLGAMPADRAVGYRVRDGKREPYDAQDYEAFHGGSNLYASAREFARFARAFASPAKPPFRVPERTLWHLVPPGDLLAVLTLGNWYCTSILDRRCYYTGHHRGFYNVMYFDRTRRLVVVYVSNSAIAPWLQPRITRELVVTAEGRLPAPPAEPNLVTLTPELLRGAEGVYDVPGAGRVTLYHVKDKPHVRAGGAGVEYRLHEVSPTLLYAPGLDAYVGLGGDGRMSWTTGFIDSYGVRVLR